MKKKQEPDVFGMSGISVFGYISLWLYGVGKVPTVASKVLQYVTFGPKAGQEDSDIRTVTFVSSMQSALADGDRITVEQLQNLAGREYPCPSHTWGIKTKYWVKDGSEIEHFVNRAVERTCPEDIDFKELPKSIYKPCTGEWEAPRKYKGSISDLSAQEKYNLMHEECTDKEFVILYLHGGAHYLGNETGHRVLVRKLAKMTGGKGFSVRYRLSPQHPFPCSITDALAAYEYLVNPPKGALHKAVNPKKIMIAGDSAGGNLAMTLSALLIESRPRWELPGALALLSPWGDLTHSLPSCRYAPNDFLPDMHGELKGHRASEIWASDGKQRQFYATDVMLLHPLVSPILYEGWSALKAVIVQTGAEERLRDEGRYIAQHMSKLGVTVQYHEYKSMPHVFQMLLHTTASHKSISSIAEYAKAMTNDQPVEACRVLRNNAGEEIEFADGQFSEYIHTDIVDAMNMARSRFFKAWPSTKSSL